MILKEKNRSFLQLSFQSLAHFFFRSCNTYFVTLMKEHKINMSRLLVEMHSFRVAKTREAVRFAQTDGKINLRANLY